MDLRFYSGDGRLIFILADYIRVSWQEHLKDEAVSEITVLKGHQLFDIITNEPVLIVCYGKRQGIVCGYKVEGDYLKITVKSLLTLLKRRLVMQDTENGLITFSGNPLEIIRTEILGFIPYLTFSGETESVPDRTVSVKTGYDLLTVSKALLEGTDIGMKITFSPKNAAFSFSFVYPTEHLLRFSDGNRNLASTLASKDFTSVKNSGYYTHPFEPPVLWEVDRYPYLVENNKAENFMKQFKVSGSTKITGEYAHDGDYLYCDTRDGALKISPTEMKTALQYLCFEENPVLILEQDLRDYNEAEAVTLLEIRKYVSELWSAEPIIENPLDLGTIISIEKEVGVEKGIKKLQVISVKTDTDKPLPEIELA